MSDKELKEQVELFLKVYVFERATRDYYNPSRPEEIKTDVNIQAKFCIRHSKTKIIVKTRLGASRNNSTAKPFLI